MLIGRWSNHHPKQVSEKMIIFMKVKLKEILKKRKNIHGSAQKNARSVPHTKYGAMGMLGYILPAI
jgi:hypothetical protein